MFYQYYEIIGSEKPVYKIKPEGLQTFSEIPPGQFSSFEEVAYLKHTEGEEIFFEPLYSKGGKE